MRKRAGRFAREEARSAQVEFIRTRWPMLICLALGILCLTALVALVGPSSLGPYLVGAGAASIPWLIVYIVVVWGGTGPQMMGGDGAAATSDELHEFAADRWTVFDEVQFDEHSDIDHVLVGPGGVFAIETKWSGGLWYRNRRATRHLRQSAVQARRASWALNKGLREAPAGTALVTTPVLVIRGPRTAELTLDNIENVEIVPARLLMSWLMRREATGLERRFIDAACKILADNERTRDAEREPKSRFIEGGAWGVYIDVAVGFGAGAVALFLNTVTLGLARTGPVQLFVLAAFPALGLIGRRSQRMHVAMTGWTVASLGLAALIGIAVVANLVI